VANERTSRYRILAHLRGGEVTESSLVSVEPSPPDGGALAVMKRLKLGTDAEPAAFERFADEARLCKLLHHPNLAKLLTAGQDDDGPVLIFEYLEGATLARLRSRAIRKGTGVPLPVALFVVREVAKGLAYAHDLADESGKPLRVVHRDVSPENVTVTYDGQVKITEFGAASTVATTTKSRENRVKGNVGYMAPEQARAEFALDARADLFALGVILWELVTGKRLWDGLSEVDVLARLADEKKLPSPRDAEPSLPEQVDALCTSLLEKVRDERVDSAKDVASAIDALLKKLPDLQTTPEKVGELTSTLFADDKAKMHAVVEASKASPNETGSALPAIGTPRAPGVSPLADVESDPRLRYGVVTPEEAPAKRVVEVIRVEASPDRRFTYAMAAVVALVVGAVAIAAIMAPKEGPKPEAKGYVPPTRPGESASPRASGSAWTEPQEVSIDIRVTPPSAKLFVDGVRKDNPFRTKVVPATFRHAIRAEADKFEARTMSLEFDRDRSIEIALVPEKPQGGGRAPAPPPAGGGTAAPRPTEKPDAAPVR
jgi:serine/threonine protein kinase